MMESSVFFVSSSSFRLLNETKSHFEHNAKRIFAHAQPIAMLHFIIIVIIIISNACLSKHIAISYCKRYFYAFILLF